ncbi:hypothetical protein KC19_10G119200, partial [Ceratodon purpureus]
TATSDSNIPFMLSSNCIIQSSCSNETKFLCHVGSYSNPCFQRRTPHELACPHLRGFRTGLKNSLSTCGSKLCSQSVASIDPPHLKVPPQLRM